MMRTSIGVVQRSTRLDKEIFLTSRRPPFFSSIAHLHNSYVRNHHRPGLSEFFSVPRMPDIPHTLGLSKPRVQLETLDTRLKCAQFLAIMLG